MSGAVVQNFLGDLNMSIKHDFTPVVNGQLTQVGASFRSSRQSVRSAVFKCECGNHTITMTRLVQIGTTKTCGKCNPRIGKDDTWNKKRTRAYIAWMNMKQRCLKPNHKDYKNYGGRGITICQRWMVFANFQADMGEPGKGLSLDRIDNSKGYEKDNCRWADARTQRLNRRKPCPAS
jgi:hypothetical protein